MEAIVLAGGLGTRLQGVIGDNPKCMAPVNGKPFLAYLLDYLEQQRCTRVILSLGHKAHIVVKWLEQQDIYFELDYIIENEPLGTGGGILAAVEEAETEDVVVVNGDTMFLANLRAQMKFHKEHGAQTTLALKEMHNFDRYGTVNINDSGLITSFEEKKQRDSGLINGGIYVINKEGFLKKNLPNKFSFEKEYLERYVNEKRCYGYRSDAYFIDIGIPADYERAGQDFKTLFP
jgi:D-glycero-alpha-D-manno-heptose 1-phosphate guanylyltransferase